MWSLLELFPEHFVVNILDIGASINDGERASYQGLVDAGRGRIAGFEPDAKERERLGKVYGPPHRFFPQFIGDGKPAVFHETNFALTGSLFEPNTPLLQKFHHLVEVTTPVAEHPVSTTRLDDIDELGDVDLIKIDIQGAELSVFQNAPRVLSETLMIQTEVEFVEMYKGQPLFADVDICLRNAGFQLHTFAGFGMRAFKPLSKADKNEGFKQVLWSDVVYVRDWMRLAEISTLKLKKYAVLMHDVMQSYDLCHVILEELDQRAQLHLAKTYRQRLGAVDVPVGGHSKSR